MTDCAAASAVSAHQMSISDMSNGKWDFATIENTKKYKIVIDLSSIQFLFLEHYHGCIIIKILNAVPNKNCCPQNK